MMETVRPKSVAMVLNSPGYGGVPVVVDALVSRLDKKRFTPYVYFLKGCAENNENKTIESRGLMSAAVAVGGASTEGGKIGAITQLASWLKQHQIDILHTHSFRPNLYGRMAGALCRASGLSIVSHYHNHYDNKWLREPASLELEKHLIPITDANIAVSASVCRHVSARVGIDIGRIDVIDNGVDIARFSTCNSSVGRERLGVGVDDLCIGLVGRVCHQKGVDLFVQAAILAADQLPQARFVIVGDIEDTSLYQQCQNSVLSAGLGDVIQFVGHFEDTVPVFNALDILVTPSRWEGFGLILAEAMAAGVPIIANSVSAIPDITLDGNAAQLVAAEDTQALADEIVKLAGDKSLRDRLVRAGRLRAKDFSWQHAVESIMSLYDRITEVDR